MPPESPNRIVVTVPGNHSLRNGSAVEAAVSAWLATRAPLASRP
jgi:hypothetical protein